MSLDTYPLTEPQPFAQPYQSLEVVSSMRGVREMAATTASGEVPGYQIDSEFAAATGIHRILTAIEHGCTQGLGEYVPFTTRSDYYVQTIVSPPHVDVNFRGLAAHVNEQGTGTVQLASLTDLRTQKTFDEDVSVASSKQDYCGPDIVSGPGIGPVFQGELVDGIITVFSEGNDAELMKALHLFKKDKGPIAWHRYASIAAVACFGESAQRNQSQHFRLKLASKEYRQLLEEWQFSGEPEARQAMERHPGKHIEVEDEGKGLYRPPTGIKRLRLESFLGISLHDIV